MTYPEPQNPDKEPDYSLNDKLASKYGHPSTYPVVDDELVSDAFYMKPVFYIYLIVSILIVLMAVIIIDPFKVGNKSPDPTPYFDNAVLTFPEGTTDWRLSPETNNQWAYYLCLIDNKWYKCYPTFIESTPAK